MQKFLQLLKQFLEWVQVVLTHDKNKWKSSVEADADLLAKAETSDAKGKAAEGLVNDILTIR